MMKSKKRILSGLLSVLLICCMMPLTAFAYADDSAATEPTETATEPTETTTEAEDTSEKAEEVPYTYTISEDGSIVITINGKEWSLESEDDEESTTTGKVTTNGGRLNLRTGAGMNYEIIDQLRNGEEVIVIGTEGDWYKVVVPEKTGYVHSDYLKLLEEAKENSEVDSATLSVLFNLMFQGLMSGEGEADADTSFTPSGNMTLIDDFFQIESLATENSPQKDKQFITLQSKSGNTFYLVIDRSGDTENVYFMNLVDEADLMALIEANEDGAAAPVCSCTEKCAVGAINTSCEICRTNMTECAGKEPEPVEEPTEEPTEPVEEPAEGGNPLMLILILAILGGGGAFAYIKFFKNKPKTKGNADLDDYDYGDEDDESMDAEWESEDSDYSSENDEENLS